MKIRIAIFIAVIAGSAFGIHKVNEFRNPPSGQLIETLQERKQLIEGYTKSPTIQLPLNK